MKIYFSAAVIFNDQRGKYYERIVKTLESVGHKVITYGVTKTNLTKINGQTEEELIEHYKKVVKWISESDLVVVEASFPSTLHIGHEIGLALDKGKPVVILYEKGAKPFFLSGNESDKLLLTEYTEANLEKSVTDVIEYAAEQADTRFNFFVSPSIVSYLDWVSKKRRIPRAVYLRRMIEEDMRSNKEYNEGGDE